MTLTWARCGEHWCSFDRLKLDALEGEVGVYAIWHDGSTNPPYNQAAWVRIGEGDIAERIREHRLDANITAYSVYGDLRVTWAIIGRRQTRRGVERFLADRLRPIVGEYPDVAPIEVNLPA